MTVHDQLWREPQRRRLVRFCAALSGDPRAAEDLAQETLLEAWRNAHKLHDPAGADRWLAAIARNVCRRWARTRGRDAAVDPGADVDAIAVDDLDRIELLELLDRALALLQPETRTALVERYVHDVPHAEIAARLGISEDAVAMRLARGKVALRRALATDFAVETADGWRETRAWCPQCARRKLVVKRDERAIAFRCPSCDVDPRSIQSALPLDNPYFATLAGDLVRPIAILTRLSDWSRRYFARGTDESDARCTRCDAPVRVRRFVRADARSPTGLYERCEVCGEEAPSSTAGLALAQPEVRRFRRAHPRAHAHPEREADAGGTAALLVRFADGNAGVDVLFARDTLRVLDVLRTN